MATRRALPNKGPKKYGRPRPNQNYRLIERSCEGQRAYIIQRSTQTGLWFDAEGYDSEVLARRRFKVIAEGEGITDRIIDRKVKHSKGAKLLAKAAKADDEEGEE